MKQHNLYPCGSILILLLLLLPQTKNVPGKNDQPGHHQAMLKALLGETWLWGPEPEAGTDPAGNVPGSLECLAQPGAGLSTVRMES